MELTYNVTSTGKGSAGVSKESEAQRIERMTAFYGDKANKRFLSAGKLLAVRMADGRTVAAHIAGGAEIPLTVVNINGQRLPLADGFVLSLATVQAGDGPRWGCIACCSAHGSGCYPSTSVNVKLLESNRFFYNPETRQLFTVSDSCWTKYVKDAPFNAAKRFVLPKGETPAVAAPAPQETPAAVAALVPDAPKGKGK